MKLLRLETITFSDAKLSDMNIVLCYVLLQYQKTIKIKFFVTSRSYHYHEIAVIFFMNMLPSVPGNSICVISQCFETILKISYWLSSFVELFADLCLDVDHTCQSRVLDRFL